MRMNAWTRFGAVSIFVTLAAAACGSTDDGDSGNPDAVSDTGGTDAGGDTTPADGGSDAGGEDAAADTSVDVEPGEDTSPEDTSPEDTAPEDTTPDDTSPGDTDDATDASDVADDTTDGGDTEPDGTEPGPFDCTILQALTPGTAWEGDTSTFSDSFDSGVASCGSTGGLDARFSVELGAGTWCIDTIGSEFDTVVHFGEPCFVPSSGPLCDDDSFGYLSQLTIEVAEPGVWEIVLDGFGDDDFGVARLVINEGVCPEVNFQCEDGELIAGEECDGTVDCTDGSDESPVSCGGEGYTVCGYTDFEGEFFGPGVACDGNADCPDGFDEDPGNCALFCDDGEEAFGSSCNDIVECTDGSDESFRACGVYCDDIEDYIAGDYCDGNFDCNNNYDEIYCDDPYVQCDDLIYRPGNECDGVVDCGDGSDESLSRCGITCPGDGAEVIGSYCDGVTDCTDGSDEETTFCDTLLFCFISESYTNGGYCDGTSDCPDGEDEFFCEEFSPE